MGLHDLDAIFFTFINSAFKVKDKGHDPELGAELRSSRANFCHIGDRGEYQVLCESRGILECS